MRKKLLKSVLVIVLTYVSLVVLFESTLGFFQPENASTLQIETTGSDGIPAVRVVARLESEGQLYVAANHWPRAWYREALQNPTVGIESETERGAYTAVAVDAAEHARVNRDNPLGMMFRFLTGFPPRYFLRLEAMP